LGFAVEAVQFFQVAMAVLAVTRVLKVFGQSVEKLREAGIGGMAG
jgi:hypothetical protein